MPETLNIGILHCGIPEELQAILLEHIISCVKEQVSITLEIFCPGKRDYRDKRTEEEIKDISTGQ